MISFSTPQKNLQVFKFVNAIEPIQDYIANEHNKLVDKYGRMNDNGVWEVTNPVAREEFREEQKVFLEQDICDPLPQLDLREEDFEDGKCVYPHDKAFWLNAFELNSVFNMLSALKADE